MRHWTPKWMRLSVQNIIIKIDEIRFRKDQVEILERFGKPETLQFGQPLLLHIDRVEHTSMEFFC